MFGALAERFGRTHASSVTTCSTNRGPGPTGPGVRRRPTGCADLDHAYLDPLYAKVNRAIRTFDRTHIVFGEPFVLFNFGTAPTAMSLPGDDAATG